MTSTGFGLTAAATTIVISSSWTIFFGIITLVYCGLLVAYLIWKGDPKNSLHTSALSWSYLTGLLVLGGVGFGQLFPMIQQLAQTTGLH